MHHHPKTVVTIVVGREAKDAEKVLQHSLRGWPVLASPEKKILWPVGDLVQRRWPTGGQKVFMAHSVIEVILNAQRSLCLGPAPATQRLTLPASLLATPLIERQPTSRHAPHRKELSPR